MKAVCLPTTGTGGAWREAARACLAADLRPEEVLWVRGEAAADLFANSTPPPGRGSVGTVPRAFVELADSVVWHRDPQRFARLYALLWRLRQHPRLMNDAADPALAQLRAMEKAVRRCRHKMTAFVRFREIGEAQAPRRSFAAWFEPEHLTLEPTAPFFASRFADMDWRIVTPDLTAIFLEGKLEFAPGGTRPPLPEDATEALWSEYFRSIFNPARLNTRAMRAEMPRRYWANMPETRGIPGLVARAGALSEEMRAAAPTSAPTRARRLADRVPAAPAGPPAPGDLAAGLRACTRCPLHRDATQSVPGEGPLDAELMLVGEQPGDLEDLSGRPFTGPAGKLLDEALEVAGIDRRTVFVTNAVKHFKFSMRGKRRIHQRPGWGEISACRWWLDSERSLVRPRLTVALGATAAEALTGNPNKVLSRRATVEHASDGSPVFLTVHPSYLLRLPDWGARAAEVARFHADLSAARAHLEQLRAA